MLNCGKKKPCINIMISYKLKTNAKIKHKFKYTELEIMYILNGNLQS